MSGGLSAEARTALVEAFRYLERHSRFKVSIRSAIRLAREECGHRFRDSEARALLEAFKTRAASGPSCGTQKLETPGRKKRARGTQKRDEPGRKNEDQRDAASRARDKVLLDQATLESTSYSQVADEVASSPEMELPGVEPPPSQSPDANGKPSAHELNALAGMLLDRIAEIRGGTITPQENSAWRRANMRAAKIWLKDATADEIANAYAEQCRRSRDGTLYYLSEARRRAAQTSGFDKLRSQAGGNGAAIDSSFDDSFGVVEVAV